MRAKVFGIVVVIVAAGVASQSEHPEIAIASVIASFVLGYLAWYWRAAIVPFVALLALQTDHPGDALVIGLIAFLLTTLVDRVRAADSRPATG